MLKLEGSKRHFLVLFHYLVSPLLLYTHFVVQQYLWWHHTADAM